MNEFMEKMARILEISDLKESDDLKAFPQWDSLSVLSVIAMLDADFGINLRAADFQQIGTAGDLWKLVQARKAA